MGQYRLRFYYGIYYKKFTYVHIKISICLSTVHQNHFNSFQLHEIWTSCRMLTAESVMACSRFLDLPAGGCRNIDGFCPCTSWRDGPLFLMRMLLCGVKYCIFGALVSYVTAPRIVDYPPKDGHVSWPRYPWLAHTHFVLSIKCPIIYCGIATVNVIKFALRLRYGRVYAGLAKSYGGPLYVKIMRQRSHTNLGGDHKPRDHPVSLQLDVCRYMRINVFLCLSHADPCSVYFKESHSDNRGIFPDNVSPYAQRCTHGNLDTGMDFAARSSEHCKWRADQPPHPNLNHTRDGFRVAPHHEQDGVWQVRVVFIVTACIAPGNGEHFKYSSTKFEFNLIYELEISSILSSYLTLINLVGYNFESYSHKTHSYHICSTSKGFYVSSSSHSNMGSGERRALNSRSLIYLWALSDIYDLRHLICDGSLGAMVGYEQCIRMPTGITLILSILSITHKPKHEKYIQY